MKQTKFMRQHNVIIGKAAEDGYDVEGGKWYIVCRIHSFIFGAPLLRVAKNLAKNLCWEQCVAFDDYVPKH